MDEIDESIEEFEWRASLEKELANSAFAKDLFEDAEKHDRKRTKYIKVAELLKELKERRASEPFINKPCISEGVCHEDKMQVLDKLRAEIEQTANEEQKYDKMWATGLRYSVKIIDKYRTKESEE